MGSSQQTPSLYIHDSSSVTLSGQILYPFAFDELMCRKVGEGAVPLVHLWRHEKALVLGLRDRSLPQAAEAMQWLRLQGYQVGVRNSGGAAVPLDPGVLNVSLILPSEQEQGPLKGDFMRMVRLIAGTLERMNVKVDQGEVAGSYCPGEYDLSIGGRKFCGISQRRQTKAFAVQAFINVEGIGERKGELVRRFYEAASGGNPEAGHPEVKPELMGTLAELTDLRLTVKTFAQALIETLKEQGGIVERHPDKPTLREMDAKAAEMRERYDN